MTDISVSGPAENIHQLSLKEGMTIADVGAGTGDYSFELSRSLAELGGDNRIYAVEVQKNLLGHIKHEADEKGYPVEVLWGDAEQEGGIKLADSICDAVIVANTLFQAEDKQAFLRECVRILKPGGELLLVDWTDSFGHMGPHPDQVLSKDDAISAARSVGLEVKRDYGSGGHHYGIVLRK